MGSESEKNSTPKILLVEDNPTVMLALETQLKKAHFPYITAHNGKQALEILDADDNIALVISDWMMPEMDGLALLTTLRGSERFKDLPFLMLTVKESSDDAVRALKAGASDYVRKSGVPEELLARAGNLVKNWELNKALKEMAIRDGLTSLFNHGYFKDILKTEVARIRRYGGELSLVMFDIDHFKRFNDQYGHPAGDFILQNLGALVLSSIRNVDIPCRYGGEEFAIILPNTDSAGTEVLAERLRSAIEQHEFRRGDDVFRITCSFGTGSMCGQTEGLDELIQKVDDALYESKKNGRNRVTSARPQQ